MVLLTALIRPLHARFGSLVDVVTSGPWSVPLLEGQPGVGEIMSVRSRKTPYWLAPDQRCVVRWLAARGLGPTWLCDANASELPMLRRAHIPADHRVDVKDHPLLPGEHATEQWRRLARVMPPAIVAGSEPSAWRESGCYLEVSTTQRADLDAWLRARRLHEAPLLLVQAGNKRTMRRGLKRLAENPKFWPNDRWAEVIRFMSERSPGYRIVLLGTGPEYVLNQELIAVSRVEGLANAADDLPIPRLIALLERAHGLVTVDSGPAHAAAAVGCPQVVLFGKASPSLYRPWGVAGADVKVLTGEVGGEPSMLGIAARQVIEAWSTLGLRGAR
jgi:hypothetical protein